MISLGGVILSDNLLLKGLRAIPAGFNQQRSEGGVSHMLVAPLESGRSLELHGWFTSAQVEALLEIAAACQPVALIHPRGTFQVYIVNTSLADWIEYVEPDPADFEEGFFTLIEV